MPSTFSHDASVAVLNDPLRAVLTSEPVIEGQLEPFLPRVVDVGETENVTGHFPGRVITSVFAREINAGNAERLYPLRFRRLAMPSEIEEVTIEIARDPSRKLRAVLLQSARQPRDLVGRQRDLLRIHPDGVDGRADGERLTVTIGDGAAVGGDLYDA